MSLTMQLYTIGSAFTCDVEGGCPLVEVLGLDSLGKQLLKKAVPIIEE